MSVISQLLGLTALGDTWTGQWPAEQGWPSWAHRTTWLFWSGLFVLPSASPASPPGQHGGQTGLNLASPLSSCGAPQTHLHSSSVKWAHIHPPHRVAVRTTVLLVVPTQHQSVKANTERKQPAQRPTSWVSTFRDMSRTRKSREQVSGCQGAGGLQLRGAVFLL